MVKKVFYNTFIWILFVSSTTLSPVNHYSEITRRLRGIHGTITYCVPHPSSHIHYESPLKQIKNADLLTCSRIDEWFDRECLTCENLTSYWLSHIITRELLFKALLNAPNEAFVGYDEEGKHIRAILIIPVDRLLDGLPASARNQPGVVTLKTHKYLSLGLGQRRESKELFLPIVFHASFTQNKVPRDLAKTHAVSLGVDDKNRLGLYLEPSALDDYECWLRK